MTAQLAIEKLETYRNTLERRSSELSATQDALEPIEKNYRDFIEAYELTLFDAGGKLPSEKIRAALAHRAMPRELLDQYRTLVTKRETLKKKISDLRAAIEVQRSILSTERVTMEAGGG